MKILSFWYENSLYFMLFKSLSEIFYRLMLNWPKPFKLHTIPIYSLSPYHFIAQASDQVAKMHNFNNKYVIVSLVKLDNFVVLAEYTGCLVLNRSLGRWKFIFGSL